MAEVQFRRASSLCAHVKESLDDLGFAELQTTNSGTLYEMT